MTIWALFINSKVRRGDEKLSSGKRKYSKNEVLFQDLWLPRSKELQGFIYFLQLYLAIFYGSFSIWFLSDFCCFFFVFFFKLELGFFSTISYFIFFPAIFSDIFFFIFFICSFAIFCPFFDFCLINFLQFSFLDLFFFICPVFSKTFVP